MSDLTYLAHHGVKGQKHGVRQWQNKDGSLTPAGRIHYGVGAARKTVGKVANAIRKQVAPTNAELNIKIRKEKSKILNKEKKAELKRLKKTGKIEDPKKDRIGHKKYSEMTDQEIADRIKRLKNEAELATLEASKNMGPGKRMVMKALQVGIQTGIQEGIKNGVSDAGKTFVKRTFGIDTDYNDKQAQKAKEQEQKAQNAKDYKRIQKQLKAADKDVRKMEKELKKARDDAEREPAYVHGFEERVRTDSQLRSQGAYIPFRTKKR